MKVLVILFVLVGISLLYSGMSEVEARTGYPFIIFLEDTTINQHSFITTDGDFPIVTVPKEQTVSIPFKVHPFVSEPLSVTFSHSIETAIPDSHKATMPNMKIEFEPFNMVLKPHESQMLNVTITALNYTQIGEHRITVTAKYPQGEPLLSTGFDVLVINTEKNPCWDKSENHARPCTLFESEKFFDFMGSAWMESKHQEMINALQSDTFHDWIEKTPNHYHWNVYQYYSDTDDYMKYLSHQSPLKQIQSGISFDEIQCKENLVLIQKYDGSPACVTESTKTKLIERGWTGDSSEKTVGLKITSLEARSTSSFVFNGTTDKPDIPISFDITNPQGAVIFTLNKTADADGSFSVATTTGGSLWKKYDGLYTITGKQSDSPEYEIKVNFELKDGRLVSDPTFE